MTTMQELPGIGTVKNPSVFDEDAQNTYISYEVSPKDGRGCAIIKFSGVILYKNRPITSEGLSNHEYALSPWRFNFLSDTKELSRWGALNPKHWAISFNDVTIDIVFSEFELIFIDKTSSNPTKTLLLFLQKYEPPDNYSLVPNL